MKRAMMFVVMIMGIGMVTSAWAQSPYVGIGLGAIEMDTGANKKSGLGGYLKLGYDFTDFNRFLGAEFRVGTSSRAAQAKVDYFLSGFLKVNLELTREFRGYALLGMTNLKTSYQTTAKKMSKTGSAFSFGFGGDYRLNRDFSVSSEWVRYATKANATILTTNFAGLDVNGFTLNLSYHY